MSDTDKHGLDTTKPADGFVKGALKFFPTSSENCERKYERRNYTGKQLVEKNRKQRQKQISVDTRALLTLGLLTVTEAEHCGYKRMAASNMLKKRGLPERPLTAAERLASGDGTGIFSSKSKRSG